MTAPVPDASAQDVNLPLEKRVFAAYPSLTTSERRIADVVLAHQHHLASYTATELARRAGVSKATAARLFKLLGYGSFEEARNESRTVRHWGAPIAAPLADGATPRSPSAEDHLNVEIENLRLTFQRLGEESVAAVTAALVATPRLWIIGLRGSFSIAQFARFLFQMMKPDVRFLPAGGLSFAEEAVDMGPGDVMFVVAYRRRPAVLPELMNLARERGATVVLLTDLTASRTAEIAHHVIRCSSQAPYNFDSYTPGVSVINYLASRVMEKLGPDAVARIETKETLHARLDPFTDPDGMRSPAKRKASPETA